MWGIVFVFVVGILIVLAVGTDSLSRLTGGVISDGVASVALSSYIDFDSFISYLLGSILGMLWLGTVAALLLVAIVNEVQYGKTVM